MTYHLIYKPSDNHYHYIVTDEDCVVLSASCKWCSATSIAKLLTSTLVYDRDANRNSLPTLTTKFTFILSSPAPITINTRPELFL